MSHPILIQNFYIPPLLRFGRDKKKLLKSEILIIWGQHANPHPFLLRCFTFFEDQVYSDDLSNSNAPINDEKILCPK